MHKRLHQRDSQRTGVTGAAHKPLSLSEVKQGGIVSVHDVRTTSSDSLQAWGADTKPWIELHGAVPGESSGRHLLISVDSMAEAFRPAAVATCQVGCTYAHETCCSSQLPQFPHELYKQAYEVFPCSQIYPYLRLPHIPAVSCTLQDIHQYAF